MKHFKKWCELDIRHPIPRRYGVQAAIRIVAIAVEEIASRVCTVFKLASTIIGASHLLFVQRQKQNFKFHASGFKTLCAFRFRTPNAIRAGGLQTKPPTANEYCNQVRSVWVITQTQSMQNTIV
ncbi:hypothetical protein CW304_30840 [Bacillus sp. UFRGS-B20]|nr:hypothetical protein CW304_30840 [Bacillus sp. UFRGS-B20]